MSANINAGALAKYVGLPLAGAAVIAAGLQLSKGWGDDPEGFSVADSVGEVPSKTDCFPTDATIDELSGGPVEASTYASRPLDEIGATALEAFAQFGSGWNDEARSGVVAAAVAGPRALGDIRPAMAEAFNAFGSGWGDGPRAAVVAAALIGQRPTDEIRSAIITAHNEFGSGWTVEDRSLVMGAAAMSDRSNQEISKVMREVFDVLPASAGWTDSDRATVLAAAVAGNRPVEEIRDAALEAFSVFGDGWMDEDRVRVVAAAVGDEASTKLATIKALVSGSAAETGDAQAAPSEVRGLEAAVELSAEIPPTPSEMPPMSEEYEELSASGF